MRSTTTIRGVTATVAAVLAAVLLAGCGGSGDGSGVASVSGDKGSAASGTGGKDDVAQAQEFVDCMRKQGVEMEDPDPETGKLNLRQFIGGGADMDKLRAGMDACRDSMPQSLKDKSDQQSDPETLGKFAACMRKNGVDVADPGPDGLDKDNLHTEDPDFPAALDNCRDLLTGKGGGR
ncbi:hypothetical protein [Streptomyces odontomachi]|uniref:hypothetical protein n=1 Tax=Streptomyces odontomachi TaxID=2944940 RepID=UPI00210E8716|nr:hypothetical protein [Streptomyces sp. ODS25]